MKEALNLLQKHMAMKSWVKAHAIQVIKRQPFYGSENNFYAMPKSGLIKMRRPSA